MRYKTGDIIETTLGTRLKIISVDFYNSVYWTKYTRSGVKSKFSRDTIESCTKKILIPTQTYIV